MRKQLGVWIATGAGVGVAMGAATHQMGTWLGIGVAVGAAMGMILGRRQGTAA
jgi:hypothetical protein